MKCWIEAAVTVLQNGSMDVNRVARLVAKSCSGETRFIGTSLLASALRNRDGLMVVSFPSYSLKAPLKRVKLPPVGWTRAAFDLLSVAVKPLELREMLAAIRINANFRFNENCPEYQLLYHLTNGPEMFIASGPLIIGVTNSREAQSHRSHRQGPQVSDSRVLTENGDPFNLHEANLESAISENLAQVEAGLKLVQRQYPAPPVGRIDLLCHDRKGQFVVVELKRFSVSSQSVIDQVTRYMGWVKDHLAKGRPVRGIVIVGSPDEKLAYSAKAVPHLEMKCFSISIKGFGT